MSGLGAQKISEILTKENDANTHARTHALTHASTHARTHARTHAAKSCENHVINRAKIM